MSFERFVANLTLFLLGWLLVGATGCTFLTELTSSSPETNTRVPTATAPAPQDVPPVVESSTPTPEATAVSQRRLTIWLPPEIGGRTQTATAVLAEQVRVFNSSHPDLQITIQQKNVSGPGGMISYLRTGRVAAPAILPDLIVVPGDRLPAIYAEELIYPLGSSLQPETMAALYPAAQAFAQPQDIILGYPFALTNLPHLAYDTAVITSTFPTSFTQMIDLPDSTLLFPASGIDGVMMWQQLYLAYGGQLFTEARQATLQAEPLRLSLAQLEQARQQGFIVSQSSNVTNIAEAWQIFVGGGSTIVQTSAGQFLQERSNEARYGVAPIPGVDGPLPPLVHSWAWAVTTNDPAQRMLAIELIEFLTQPDNLGTWSQAANILPARTDALAVWPADDPYTQFLGQELEQAQPNLVVAGSQLANVLRDAVVDVTSLTESSGEAANNATAVFE